ncbi:hypothetical protein ACQPXH_24995 [Nocardia sp. CA-135953]|uniref:hypothetical protein n=1 Tax=Nocardia sp. CA-135953 TaxID=3239978 RepID=UPI003D9652B2
MPDEYDAVRRDLSNYEKGVYFELGRAHERGETQEKGWVRQFEIRTSEGPRVLDSARTDGRGTRSVERKSGRVNERGAHEQLKKERAGLESQQLTHSTWETVEGEQLPDKVREDMHELSRDFPGRFHHEIVSRTDAARAIRLGQSLMSKQLELIRAYELTRADRARKRLEKIREIVRAREPKARQEPAREKRRQHREKEPKTRAVEREPADARRESDPDRAEQPAVAKERTDRTPKGRKVREREEAQAREIVNNLGSFLSDAQKEQVLAARREERENERKNIVIEMKPTRGQEPPMPPPVPQRTPEQEREDSRARAREAGLSPEIMGIMGLNSDSPHQMIDADQARARVAAERDRSQQRERAERERQRGLGREQN